MEAELFPLVLTSRPEQAPVAVDFETYYDKQVTLKELGVPLYVEHPKAAPYLVSIYADDGAISYVGPVEQAPWDKIHGRCWWSHNAFFDALVFASAIKRGLIPESIRPLSWDCTADLSVFLKAPRSLAGAVEALFAVPRPPKDVRDSMEGLTLEDAKAKGLLPALEEYALADARWCWRLASEFGGQWPETEILISRLNRRICARGVWVDAGFVASSIAKIKECLWEFEQQIPWEWETTPLSLLAAREQCRLDGVPAPSSFAEDSDVFEAWAEKYADRCPWVRPLQQWRKHNIVLKRLQTVQRRVRENGTFPFQLKYFGAHTGRFSGDGGFNMQNMPREYPETPEYLRLRRAFVPKPGSQFAIVDMSQIEARVLLYLAKDYAQLDLIRSGVDVYEAHARKTLGYDQPEPLAVKAKQDAAFAKLRQFAKARVLGLGYGCGAARFISVAKSMAGLDLSAEEAEAVVRDYRASNPLICRLWRALGSLLEYAAKKQDPFLKIKLPSGRALYYFDPHFDGLTMQVKARVERNGPFYSFFGGKLVENCVQAISRDLFVHSLLLAEKRGHDLVFHVHDEGVWHAQSEDQLRDLEQCLATPPEWAPDLPLGAEGHLEPFYCKK